MVTIKVVATSEEQANHGLVKTDDLVAMGVKRMGQEYGLGPGAHFLEECRVLAANEMERSLISSHVTLHATILPKGHGVAHDLRQRERGEILAQQAVVMERLAVGHGHDARLVGEKSREAGGLLTIDPHHVGRIFNNGGKGLVAEPEIAKVRVAQQHAQHCKAQLEHPRHPPWLPHYVNSHPECALRLLHVASRDVVAIIAPHLKRRLLARSLDEMVRQGGCRPTVVEGGHRYGYQCYFHSMKKWLVINDAL